MDMATTFADTFHDVSLLRHDDVYSWTCHLCSSWGHGARTETAALDEIADHVALFCPDTGARSTLADCS